VTDGVFDRPFASARSQSGRRDALVILVVAGLLLLPSLLLGTLFSHSSPHNLAWAAQFSDQFRAGVLYPRWLPESYDGLGSVTFYFYPPIAFWAAALPSVLTLGTLSPSYCLSLASLLLLWVSGVAMRAWLRAVMASPRTALYGALAYMAAPYHLVDHYYRGAFAEFAAYAVLPLLALAVRRIAHDQRHGVLALAAAYAALPMAHLPTSLLVSLTVLPLYVLYLGWRMGAPAPALKFFARCVSAGVLGLGLAAIYLAPALTLQDWIPADNFWEGPYRVQNWFLLTPHRWPPPTDMMLIIVSCALAYAIGAVGVIVAQVRRQGRPGWRSEPVFWSLTCLLCVLLMAGALPWFWLLPFVAKVQFPWRLLIVAEFAAVTAFCLAPWAQSRHVMSAVLKLALLAIVPAVAILLGGIRYRVDVSLAETALPADAKDYLPAGFPLNPYGAYHDLGLEPLKAVATIACAPAARVCRASKLPLGELAIEIDGDSPTNVVVRRFAYPFWKVEPALPVTATTPLRLVSFTAPAGRHDYRLVHARPEAEKAGWTISGISLILALSWLAIARARSARRRLTPPAGY